MAAPSKYSCETAAKTLEWITAITEFIKPYTFLTSAHVVNFFLDRLWETVDKEWMDCLRNESVENLLLIPSGVVQDHWPTSLKEFVYTSRSLVFPQEQADLHVALPYLDMIMLNSVVTQGMNLKKKHEVEYLSAVVSSVAKHVKADLIVDVGSGQGYLAQVLSFQYDHSVVAIDACSHHGRVTDARAERIRRHYVSRMQKSQSAKRCFKVPRTVTCRVISPENLKALADASLTKEDVNQPNFNTKALGDVNSSQDIDYKASLILAGLHACGDLSVTMIKI